jgi:hypothetical protein
MRIAGKPVLTEETLPGTTIPGKNPHPRSLSPHPLYRIKCPMVFRGKGATWLMPDETVRNPYYGFQMLGCGEVLEVIR